jgi:hypothetical protein
MNNRRKQEHFQRLNKCRIRKFINSSKAVKTRQSFSRWKTGENCQWLNKCWIRKFINSSTAVKSRQSFSRWTTRENKYTFSDWTNVGLGSLLSAQHQLINLDSLSAAEQHIFRNAAGVYRQLIKHGNNEINQLLTNKNKNIKQNWPASKHKHLTGKRPY